jgi:selenocysteine lyase/cysteine desulfurase
MSKEPPVAAFRRRFPMLERRVHLSSCSLGARSVDLDEAMLRMLEDMTTNGRPWELFEAEVLRARCGFAALIGAGIDQIALVPNASVGAYQVASTMDWKARSKIVTTTMEFPSIAHVWLAQRPRGVDVVYASTAEQYPDLIDRRASLVSVPLVTYRHAHRLPVANVARVAHAVGASVFVDAYQAVGVLPVNVNQLDCDFLVAGTMKYLLGLPGLAFLYVRSPELIDRTPRLTGWWGRVDPRAFNERLLDFAKGAAKFETGTPAVPACYAANAGLRLIETLDLADVSVHVSNLTELAIERLAAQGEQVSALSRDRRGAHIGLLDPAPLGLAGFLANRGITVSPQGEVLRVSFHQYNDADDVAALCAGVRDYRFSAHGDHESRGRSRVGR